MQLEDLDRIGTCYSLTPGLIRPCLSLTIFSLKTTTEKQNKTEKHLQFFYFFKIPVVPGSRVSMMQLEDLDRIGTCYGLFRQNRNLLWFI